MRTIDPVTGARTYKKLDGKPLLDWYSIRITNVREDTKEVTFCSRIHVNKEVVLPTTYSDQFTDEQILRDGTLFNAVISRWGDVFQCQCHRY